MLYKISGFKKDGKTKKSKLKDRKEERKKERGINMKEQI